ncbi:imidazolonepropionase [Actinomycetes bacterium NPDC127524]
MHDLVVRNISQLILPESSFSPLKGKEMSVLKVKENAAFAVKDKKVSWIGNDEEADSIKAGQYIDVQQKIVSPGLIDPHTHLVFGGSRENEMPLKQKGINYLEILAGGGGILSTVAATKRASEEELFQKASFHLERMISFGVTALEAKSGYGLDRDTEIKQLRVIQRLQNAFPAAIVPTFLGPHAIPLSYKGREEDFLDEMIGLLDEISHKNLAEFADIFCETGVFTAEQSRKYLKAAKSKGFGLKIHADEIDTLGGAELAAELEAASGDHLVAVSDKGIKMLSDSKTVAVLLPGTTFYLGKDAYAPARRMIDNGLAIALATDFNPGSCVTENLQLIMSLAALKLNMSAEEIWNSVTVNAAHAIGLNGKAGTIEIGKPATFVIWDADNYHYIPYHFGVNHAKTVYLDGNKIWERQKNEKFQLSDSR